MDSCADGPSATTRGGRLTWVRTALGAILAGAVLLPAGCVPGESRSGSGLNVLLLTIETLRGDRLGCYGHDRPISPALDRLAREGVVFENAIAPSCFTAPSLSSISTGLYPISHGVLNWGDRGSGMRGRTAAEVFGGLGYRTGFFSAHGALERIAAITRGFDRVEDRESLPAARLTDAAVQWVGHGRRPFFLWVHYFEPHAPYSPSEYLARRCVPSDLQGDLGEIPYESWLQRVTRGAPLEFQDRARLLVSLYDAEIAMVDREISRWIDFLERTGLRDRTVIAITADHGENLADHAPFFDHRNFLYDSLVRVPLIVWAPGLSGGRHKAVPVPVQSLLPTLLDLLGEEQRDWFQVTSLGRGLAGGEPAPSAVFLDSGLQEIPHKGVRDAGWKLTYSLTDGRRWLYDLETDPGELRPIAPDPGDARATRLGRLLEEWLGELRRARPARKQQLTPSERARLAALGYLVPDLIPNPREEKTGSGRRQ